MHFMAWVHVRLLLDLRSHSYHGNQHCAQDVGIVVTQLIYHDVNISIVMVVLTFP